MAAHRYWLVAFSKWRYSGTVYTANSFARIGEVKFYTAAEVKWPTAAMTALSSPAPFVVTTDGTTDTNGWKAFDGNENNPWSASCNDSKSVRLFIDMGSAVDFSRIEIVPDTTAATNHVIEFSVFGSDTADFAQRENLGLFSDLYTGWTNSTARSFPLAPPAAPVIKTLAPLQRITGAVPPAPTYKRLPDLSKVSAYTGTQAQLFVGPGYVAGPLSVIDTPASRIVHLYDLKTAVWLRTTRSAADGTYRFDNMALGRKYFVVGLDDDASSPRRKADVNDYFEAVLP